MIFTLPGTLEPTYRQLQTMQLDQSPFVIISVIGQELLAQSKYQAAVQVLVARLAPFLLLLQQQKVSAPYPPHLSP